MYKLSQKTAVYSTYFALAIVTLAVYWQVSKHDFLNYDDSNYITKNEHVTTGLTYDNIIWAFTSYYASNWHPLTWLSHMLDCELFGLKPAWPHIENPLLHLANILLLFAILKRMTSAIWQNAFVAALFALHPLHIESVAWIAERKDVLSTLLGLLTILVYTSYVNKPKPASYLLAILLFALGLLAKPMLVTLPFILLLLDYWPLQRFQYDQTFKNKTESAKKRPGWQRLLVEKIPFFALSASSCIITFLAQRAGGSVAQIDILPIRFRVPNVIFSYIKYIWKMIWPNKLAIFYPHPINNLPLWLVLAAAVLLLAATAAVVYFARKYKYLPVGWFWYLGTLVPVIGLVQVGGQALADRYTYMTLTGLFIIIAWGVPELLAKWRHRNVILAVIAISVLTALSTRTYFQLRHWSDNETIFKHALDVTKNNSVANIYLAQESAKRAILRVQYRISRRRIKSHPTCSNL